LGSIVCHPSTPLSRLAANILCSSFPDCSTVGNTTELPPPEVWRTCPYHNIDGEFNPDGRLIDNIGDFSDLADAVLYNTIAWVLTNRTTAYEQNAVGFIYTWFLNPDTKMNPNLKYAQMDRGPKGQMGAHTGILDLKCMTKIVNAITMLRKANSTVWTEDLDSQMVEWANTYITWLKTWPTAIQESESPKWVLPSFLLLT
jgi:Alginate lyase